MDSVKYDIYWDAKTGSFQLPGFANALPSDASNVNRFPAVIPAGTSLTLEFNLYQDFGVSATVLDCSGATASLKARPLNSGYSETTLVSGVSPTPSNVFTMAIPKTAIIDAWAAYPTTRLLLEVDDGSTKRLRIYQDIKIISLTDTTTGGLVESENIPVSLYIYSSDTTMTNSPGYRVILIDTSSNDVTVDLPAAGSNDGQIIEVQHVVSGNVATINPGTDTINGSTDDVVLDAGESLYLVEYNGAWYHINATTVL